MNPVYDRLVNLLSAKFGVAAEDVSSDSTFEDLEFDSLALLEFALATGEEFGVRISEEELTPASTLADAAELVQAKGLVV